MADGDGDDDGNGAGEMPTDNTHTDRFLAIL